MRRCETLWDSCWYAGMLVGMLLEMTNVLRGTRRSRPVLRRRRCAMILLNIAARCIPVASPPSRMPQRPPPPSRRETLVATLTSRPTISVISVLETAIPRSARRATPACLASRPACTYTLSPTPIAVSPPPPGGCSPPPPGGAGAQPLARPQGVESRSGIAGPASG